MLTIIKENTVRAAGQGDQGQRDAGAKQIQTPRYIVQNSMNLKQYRHRPSHDSIQCFNLFPASAEKIRKTYRLRKRVFGKKFPRENYIQFIQNLIPFKKFHYKSHPY